MSNNVNASSSSSKKLSEYVKNWPKKPSLDVDLSGVLDGYITEMNNFEESTSDSRSSQLNFAEAAIFLQNWSDLYDKKVDLLLKSFIKLHIALCDISSNANIKNTTEPPKQNDQPVAPENEIKPVNKRKKKDIPQPQDNNTIEPQPSTSTATVEPQITVETNNNSHDVYSAKELQEIGVLWNMLNNMERKKIENILNKIDEETTDDDNVENNSEHAVEKQPNKILPEAKSVMEDIIAVCSSRNLNRLLANDLTNTGNKNSIGSNETSINTNTENNPTNVGNNTIDSENNNINSENNKTDVQNNQLNIENNKTNAENNTTNTDNNKTDVENNSNTFENNKTNNENIINTENNPNNFENNKTNNQNITNTENNKIHPENKLINSKDQPVSQDTEDETCFEDDNYSESPENLDNDKIDKLKENEKVETRIECLRKVRVRLERLSKEILSNLPISAKKFMKNKGTSALKESGPYETRRKIKPMKCTNCGCCKVFTKFTNLKDESKITKCEAKEKVKSEKRISRKRSISIEEKQKTCEDQFSHICPKKLRLLQSFSVLSTDFENFYKSCYNNLKWIDGELVCIKSKSICDVQNSGKSHLPDVETLIAERSEADRLIVSQADSGLGDSLIDSGLEISQTDSGLGDSRIDSSLENTQIESGLDNDDTLESGNENDADSEYDNVSEITSPLNAENTNIEKCTLILTENDSIEAFKRSQILEVVNLSIDKYLSNQEDKNRPEGADSFLTESFFDNPSTPPGSEDSGRFSATTYHSDTETESQLNAMLHTDSGVEMSPKSEHAKYDKVPAVLKNPFEKLDSSTINFYKKKCESLLEQRERDEKVAEWDKFLKEKSEKSKQLPVYNINEYETKILNKFSEKKKKELSFKSLVSGKSVEEVSRFFLATLQLANMENIRIKNDTPGLVAKDSIKIKCVTKERYYENLNNFPSEENFLAHLNNLQREKPFMQSTPSSLKRKSSPT